MIYWMNSKTFRDSFLMREDDKDILKSQYVLVSTHIGYSDSLENVINATSILFPSPEVFGHLDWDMYEDDYFKQLEKNKTFFAQLIKGSIQEKFNIVFLCSKSESKFKYMQYISEFIRLEFDYPCYDYKKFVDDGLLYKYNKDKVLKKCEKLIKIATDKRRELNSKTKEGRKENKKELKQMKKKELIKLMKDKGIYTNGLDKDDMVEMLSTFT